MSEAHFEIAVSLQDAAWGEQLEDIEGLAERAMRAVWHRLGAGQAETATIEISLVFADDAAVAELNRGYRGREGPTNVLSFPNMDDEDFLVAGGGGGDPGGIRPRLLGDVILARQTVLREATEQVKSVRDHTLHLVVHGLLHLFGHDHEDAAEAEEMEGLETAILADLGVADPYRPPARDFEAAVEGSPDALVRGGRQGGEP